MTGMALGADREQSHLISLPLQAHFSKMKVSELPYKVLGIKLKEPRNRQHIDTLKEALKERLESLGYDKEDFDFRDIMQDWENLDQV